MSIYPIADAAASLGAGQFVHWGVIQISLTNLLIIVAMIALFVLALVLPFPGSHAKDTEEVSRDDHH